MNKQTAPRIDLLDADAQAARHPDTFEVPPLKERQALPEGAFAKLVFIGNPTERMWVICTQRTPEGNFIGELVNAPLYLKTVRYGQEVIFEPRHIIDIDLEPVPPQEAA